MKSSAGVPHARDSVFPFIVQETGREPAKLEIEVQVLVKGPLFSSRGEITIMRRFERRVVGGSPAARSIFLRVAEKLRPPPSKRIDAGANPAAGTFGGETGRGAGTRLKRIGRPAPLGSMTSRLRHFFGE